MTNFPYLFRLKYDQHALWDIPVTMIKTTFMHTYRAFENYKMYWQNPSSVK